MTLGGVDRLLAPRSLVQGAQHVDPLAALVHDRLDLTISVAVELEQFLFPYSGDDDGLIVELLGLASLDVPLTVIAGGLRLLCLLALSYFVS